MHLIANTPAVVFFIHGLHEHAGRHFEVFLELGAARFAAYSMDLIGHGKSEGARGAYPSVEVVTTDIARFIMDTMVQYPELPYFIFAKATGAIFVPFVLHLLSEDRGFMGKPPLGVLFSSPAGRVEKTYSAPRKAAARAIALFAPSVGVGTIKVEMIHRDPKETAVRVVSVVV
jgi:acylglycerol lipase